MISQKPQIEARFLEPPPVGQGRQADDSPKTFLVKRRQLNRLTFLFPRRFTITAFIAFSSLFLLCSTKLREPFLLFHLVYHHFNNLFSIFLQLIDEIPFFNGYSNGLFGNMNVVFAFFLLFVRHLSNFQYLSKSLVEIRRVSASS